MALAPPAAVVRGHLWLKMGTAAQYAWAQQGAARKASGTRTR